MLTMTSAMHGAEGRRQPQRAAKLYPAGSPRRGFGRIDCRFPSRTTRFPTPCVSSPSTCSTEWLAVAWATASGSRERREHAGQAHSERVLPLVDALLAEVGWKLRTSTASPSVPGPARSPGYASPAASRRDSRSDAGSRWVRCPRSRPSRRTRIARRRDTRLRVPDARMGRSTSRRTSAPTALARGARPGRGRPRRGRAACRDGWFGAGDGFAGIPRWPSVADSRGGRDDQARRTRDRRTGRAPMAGQGTARRGAAAVRAASGRADERGAGRGGKALMASVARSTGVPAARPVAADGRGRPRLCRSAGKRDPRGPVEPRQLPRRACRGLWRHGRGARRPHPRLRRDDAGARRGAAAQPLGGAGREAAGARRRVAAALHGRCRRAGAEQMFLEVRISNAAAIGLYEAAGFVAVGDATRNTRRDASRHVRGCIGHAAHARSSMRVRGRDPTR